MKFLKVSEQEFAKRSKEGYQNIVLPKRATKGSAGYDFVTPVRVVCEPHSNTPLYPTGIRCQIDEGWVLMLYVRSSIGVKKGLTLSNGTGVIDSDYFFAENEGHIQLALHNNTDQTVVIEAGERVMQGVFVPFGVCDDDNVTTERTGGFGSTN